MVVSRTPTRGDPDEIRRRLVELTKRKDVADKQERRRASLQRYAPLGVPATCTRDELHTVVEAFDVETNLV